MRILSYKKNFTIIIFFIFIIGILLCAPNILSHKITNDYTHMKQSETNICTKYVFDTKGDFIYSKNISSDIINLCENENNMNEYINSNIQKNLLKECFYQNNAKKNLSLFSKYNCVINASNNKIIYGTDCFNKVANASTTKILTCIVALENSKPDDIITASEYAASMPDVQLNMKPGEQFYIKDLLYSLMLESHNDTAVAIAEHVGGSVEGFAKMMNKKAKDIGCKNTHFVTPNGLDDKNHYTCAYDLCLIASYASTNKTFMNIISAKNKSIQSLNKNRTFSLNNKNRFLTMYKGAIGFKTGFTGNAGYCFVGGANIDKNKFISCVLACGWPPDKNRKWQDTISLMDYAKKNTNTITIKRNTINNIEKYAINNMELYCCPNYNKVKEELKYSELNSNITINNLPDENIRLSVCLKRNINLSNDSKICAGIIIISSDDYIYKILPFNINYPKVHLKYIDYLKNLADNFFVK